MTHLHARKGNPGSRGRQSVVILFWILIIAPPIHGQYEPWARPVIHTGQEIPGHEDLATQLSNHLEERIGPGGHALISAGVQGDGVSSENDQAVFWSDPHGNIELVFREGDQTDYGPFTREQEAALSASGNIAILVNLGSGSSFARALYAGAPGSLTAILGTGDTAPGDWGDGGGIVDRIIDLRVNASGTMAFTAIVRLDASTQRAVYVSNGGPPRLLIRSHRNYPGMLPPTRADGPETVFTSDGFDGPMLNEAGDLAFKAKDNYGRTGIWIWSGGRLSLAALEERTGGPGGPEIYGMEILSFVGSDVALSGQRFGPGIDSSNDEHIWVASKGSLSLVAREGQAAPVPEGAQSGTFLDGFRFSLSASGAGALTNSLSTGKRGVWAWKSGLTCLALVDGEVPGYPDNAWARIDEVTITPSGLIAARASHTGPDQAQSNLWISDRGSPLQEVSLPDTLTLPDGTLKSVRVREILISPDNTSSNDSLLLGFSARHELLIEYDFDGFGVLSFDGQLDLGSVSGSIRLDGESQGLASLASTSVEPPEASDNGEPDEGLEGVPVRIYAAEDGAPAGGPVQSTVTGPRGTYQFKELPHGNYSVVAELLPGFLAITDSDDGEGDVTEGRIAVELGVGERADGLEFRQARQPGNNQVIGRLLYDPDGDGDASDASEGIEGVAFMLGPRDKRPGLTRNATTDSSGSFVFNDLPEGEYLVGASLPYDSTDRFTADLHPFLDNTAFQIVSVPSEDELTFLAASEAIIAGAVVDADNSNQGLPGARIRILNADGKDVEGVSDVTTNATGSFQFSVPPGSYIIRESDPPGYESISDSDLPNDDNQIAVTVSSGETASDHEFADRRLNFPIILRSLENDGIANLNEPRPNQPLPPIEPIRPVSDDAKLAEQPSVTDGLVADGVTPLVIEFSLQTDNLEEADVYWACEAEPSGAIRSGIESRMWSLVDGEWEKASVINSQVILTQDSPRAFVYIEALNPEELEFEPGTTEAFLNFKLFANDRSGELLSERRIAVRRLPLVFISDARNEPWKESFIAPFRESTHDSFLFLQNRNRPPVPYTIHHLSQGQVNERWAVNRVDAVASGRSLLFLSQYLKTGPLTSDLRFRTESNHFRGLYRRIVAVGAPNNGTRLTPFLKELDRRLAQLDPSGLFSQYTSQSQSPRTSWERLLTNVNPNVYSPPADLDPENRFFKRRVAFDPGSRLLFIATEIDPGQSKALRKVGLEGDILVSVFPEGSDGLVDRNSVRAAAVPNLRNFRLFTASPLSQPSPPSAFGAEHTHTTSPAFAAEILSRLNEPANSLNFAAYQRPIPLSSFDINTLVEAARDVPARKVVNLRRVAQSILSPQSSAASPSDAHAVSGKREFVFELPLLDFQPMAGEAFWDVEVYGPNGVTTDGVSVSPDPEQTNAATVTVDLTVVGDVVLYASYQTHPNRIAFARPVLVTSQEPLGLEIQRIELLPADLSLELGQTIQPEFVTVYEDGTRIVRWLDASALASLESSNPDSLAIVNGRQARAVGPGDADLSIEAFGLSAQTSLHVEEPTATLSYEEWKAQHFAEPELSDPAHTGPNVDLDRDGLSLLEEYFSGGDPKALDADFGPQFLEVTIDGQSQLVFAVRISKQIDPASSRPENSTDLLNWSSLLNPANGPNFESLGLLAYAETESHVELFFDIEPFAAFFFRYSVDEN